MGKKFHPLDPRPEDVDVRDIEARDFMAPLIEGWHHRPEHGFDILPDRISPWTPGKSKYEFLRRFTELKGKP